jgi:hypothetical protein
MNAMILLASLLFAWAYPQGDWKPAGDRIRTRFAADVNPAAPLPEYPRPQMERADWQSLNGLWDFGVTTSASSPPAEWKEKILVPFPVESSLSGIGRRVDEKSRAWYRRTFAIPESWEGRRILLHFGAVDWETSVEVNGKPVGSHRGGYDAFSFDITECLVPQEKQTIVVSVQDPTEGDQPRGKQVREPGGIFYTSCTGIWQSVWIEPVPVAHIDRIVLTPRFDEMAIEIDASASGTSAPNYSIAVSAAGREVARADNVTKLPARIAIPNMREWTPESPFLYDLKVDLAGGDSVKSYFGMRKIAIGRDEKGVTRILLNNRFVPHVGTLDQGFWPDGIYTAPTDAALKYDIELLKQLGFNMTRKHVKVEPDRWYAWCDRMGLLVWQDMPSGNNSTPASKEQFERELARMVDGLRNHPCIVLWVVFNEGWGEHDVPRMVETVKRLDPTRLVDNASGWTDMKCGDVIDIHNYPAPAAPAPEATRAAVLGEFGGLGLPVDGHTWSKQHWGYQGMADSKRLTRQYVRFLQKAWDMIRERGLSAVVYTQTTDVETECNGLLTYDRAIVKLDVAEAAAANRGMAPAIRIKPLVADARETAVAWKYTFDKPADGWERESFDASAWKVGEAGFGTKGTPGAVVRTEWKSDDVWMRREFEWKESPKGRLCLIVHHDENSEVYINGVLAAKLDAYTTDYEEFDLPPAAAAAIRPGKNVLAVHCRQTTGGQYIDVGIATEQ